MKQALQSAFVVFALSSLAGSLVGCTSSAKRVGSDGPYGPAPQTEAPSYGPAPLQGDPITLVLGPGLARGYAHIGVLRALSDARIPVGQVFGTEMGALVGAAFAASSTADAFEWNAQHLKEEIFTDKGLLSRLGGKPSEGKKLIQALKKLFTDKTLETLNPPCSVALSVGGRAEILSRGPLVPILRAAVAHPSILLPGEWEGQEASSASALRPFLVTEAKANTRGRVLVVDVLLENESQLANQELANADWVLRPQLQGIGYLDFSRRAELIFRGKKAVQDALPEIRRLAGLPIDGGY